jgi:phage-related protein
VVETSIKALKAEVEMLAKQLLKIDRRGKEMKKFFLDSR